MTIHELPSLPHFPAQILKWVHNIAILIIFASPYIFILSVTVQVIATETTSTSTFNLARVTRLNRLRSFGPSDHTCMRVRGVVTEVTEGSFTTDVSFIVELTKDKISGLIALLRTPKF
jgi:hypothetical protein